MRLEGNRKALFGNDVERHSIRFANGLPPAPTWEGDPPKPAPICHKEGGSGRSPPGRGLGREPQSA